MVNQSKIKLDIEVPTTVSNGENPVKVYLGYSYGSGEWEKNAIFEDTLKFVSTSKGRSSIKFNFVGLGGTQYEMFLKDFTSLALTQAVTEVKGKWAFCKRGANYGITKIID